MKTTSGTGVATAVIPLRLCLFGLCCCLSAQLLLSPRDWNSGGGGVVVVTVVESFSPSNFVGRSPRSRRWVRHRSGSWVLGAKDDDDGGDDDDNDNDDDSSSSSSLLSNYKDPDGAVSKGIVGSLTGLVNKVSSVAASENNNDDTSSLAASSDSKAKMNAKVNANAGAPKTPQELLERIRKDYDERNYLWTGDLDLGCFDTDCVFTDPTISFVGTDAFTENTQNLVPIVEAFAQDYRSDLLSISLGSASSSSSSSSGSKAGSDNANDDANDDADGFYVETRWNMVGSLTASPWLFWKPKIDVIGRTKFWFRPSNDEGRGGGDDDDGGGGYKVYFYDESWEIAAWKALLQIVTPAGTFPSTTSTSSSSTS